MAGPNTITIVKGQLRFAVSDDAGGGTGLLDANCQTTSAAVNATPNLQTVPATFCSPESQSPAATGWELAVTLLQDWEDPDGICWYVFDHDTELADWELALSDDQDAIMHGQCRLVAASFGGDAGTVLTSQVTWPCTQKPSKGPSDIGAVPATGATAGTPGSFTPSGSTPPADTAALIASSITASPTTAWTTGQYVQTATSGVGGRGYWNGTAWVAGAAS